MSPSTNHWFDLSSVVRSLRVVALVFLVSVLPLATDAVEKESVSRLLSDYQRISGQVAQLSEDLRHIDQTPIDPRKVLGLLDKVALSQERLAHYDISHHLTALEAKQVFPEHATLRGLFYAYEAMAQMLSAEMDYQVTRNMDLRKVAEKYREVWTLADTALARPPAP